MFYIFFFIGIYPPRAVTFSWWGIEYLNDPESYAEWSFILLIGPPMSDRLMGTVEVRQSSSTVFSVYFSIFLPFTFLFFC